MDELLARVRDLPVGTRQLVAIAGPPASGKSTLAAELAQALNAAGRTTVVVPMDGFHLDNRLLDEAGLRHRKGAPETFDVGGFSSLVARLGQGDDVIFPLFDRDRDIAIAGAGRVAASCDLVILEGNYLLYDAPVWGGLAAQWTLSAFLEVPRDVLEARLVMRWTEQGMDARSAQRRASENDLLNAEQVLANRLPSDITL